MSAAVVNTNGETKQGDTLIDCNISELHYGKFKAVRDVAVKIVRGTITAFIGPSGCGKSTALRCLNRMNDLVRGFRLKGHVIFRGQDIYTDKIDPVAVRRRNRNGLSAAESVRDEHFPQRCVWLAAQRIQGRDGEPRRGGVALGCSVDEVKDKLKSSGLSLSGGQQQRLCIARAIATEPAVLLMDEPCSALDPIATHRIEELMHELKKKYTIAIVTHNLQQAKRVADMTAFLYVDTTQGGRTGYMVEYAPTAQIFENPKEQYTKDYLMGGFS
jgi:phosphate transport system ATP-binding protein